MSPVSELRGARCLVTGAGGFIGTNLSLALSALGVSVEGFGRRPAHAALAGTTWHEADFSDAARLERAMRGQEYVVHLLGGALPVQSNADFAGDVERNLLPSLRLIELCGSAGVRRVVFASSGGTVYGVTAPGPIGEDHPTNPITAYGINKLAVEKYLGLARYLHGLDAVVLRIANPYGPYQSARRPQGIVGTLLARALSGEPVEIWGDGSVVRDYVHVQDVAAAVTAAMTYRGAEWVFNVGSGRGRTLREVVEAVASVADLGPDRIRYLPARAADVPANVLDTARLRTETGWSPLVRWEDGVAATAAWMRAAAG